MQYDRKITICTAGSREAAYWPAQELYLAELWEKLKVPARGTETMAEYLAMKKPRQDELKDVGGYVAGTLENGRRKAAAVTGRDIITLDLDNAPPGGAPDILRRLSALGCGYCAYSTRKHSPAAPRLRVLIPTDRTVSADEYEPLARKTASYIDPSMKVFDPSTFEASRLMYWPSCCSDGEYIYQQEDKPLLSADGVLAQYRDWRAFHLWPQVPGSQQARVKLAAKQGDPEEKGGIVGAFCRTYSIYDALEKYIPGVYVPTEIPGRYTFTGGSTTGGAIIYEDGKFIYSHHATDPAGGRLCNAFDLCRLHLYGSMDDGVKPDTPVNKLPSFVEMRKLAVKDPTVIQKIDQEREQEVTKDFAQLYAKEEAPEDPHWKEKLSRTGANGEIDNTIDNAWIILENDPLLKGRFALNEFANRAEVFGPLPWSKDSGRRQWDDNDNYGLYWYMEKRYRLTNSSKVDGALSLHSRKHSFNEVVEYLQKLKWDGAPRLDTLLIDYLGAADSEYTRAVTRKSFTAAVARAMEPGCKYDQMTVISGPQGIGKSTLLRKMGRKWFSDSVRDFSRIKDTAELLQGVWIVEVGELGAMRGADVNKVKQLMSQQIDRFRAAYARHVKDCPRCCVFFGTSNDREYLQDKTGNRRFWPVDAAVQAPTKSVFNGLEEEVDQLWAEAVTLWSMGEPLFLSGAEEAAARIEQQEHLEKSPWEGTVLDFLEKKVPADWSRRSMQERILYWNGDFQTENLDLVPRDRVCAQEIWCEALGRSLGGMKRSDAIEINGILLPLEGWEKCDKAMRFGCYGAQKGFRKV